MQRIVVNLETGEQSVVDFTPDEIQEIELANAVLVAAQSLLVPLQVPLWAVRTVLQNNGLFAQADALIKGSSDNALRNYWEYGNDAHRESPIIASMASTLGLSNDQVDQMFRDAGSLSP